MNLKFKHIAIALVALLLGFASCSSENDGPVAGDNLRTVFLKINNQPVTYAVSSPQTATPVTFTSGNLYFTNSAGNILKHYTISDAETTDTNIQMSELSNAGAAITNLPLEVTGVYVVGNTKDLPQTGPISGVQGKLLHVTSQTNIETVNLYGKQTTLTPAGENKFRATVSLTPIISRIELGEIKAGGTIESFDVAGIFIDNYYEEATVDGQVGDVVSNSTETTSFTDNSTEYPKKLYPAIYDWYADGLKSVNKTAAPANGNIWAYNLFAGNSVPRMIIRLANIEVSEGSTPINGDRFITIKGFKHNGVSLSRLEAGKVYRLGAGVDGEGKIEIDDEDVQETPNISTIDVSVSIELAKWELVDVTPDIEK